MNKNMKLKLILAAAVSVTVSSIASAQYRIGNDGHALDANNRVGSGGLNTESPRPLPYNIGNDIVTGNVTGGREFRGNIPYSNPYSFRGPTAGGLSDQFIRDSSAAPYGGIPQNNAQSVVPFYGTSDAAPPPPGFAQQGFGTGANVPAPTLLRQPGDLRVGSVFMTPTTALPQPGQLLLPGPVDANTQTFITASPLYGVRQWNPGLASDQPFIDNNVTGRPTANGGIDPVTMQHLRDELLVPEDQTGTATMDQQPAGPNGQQNPQQQESGQGLGNGPQRAFESPRNGSINSSAALQPNQLVNAGVNSNLLTGEGVRQRLMGPQQQSTQYAELSRRLQQYKMVQASNAASEQRDLARDIRARQQAAAANPAGTTPGAGGTARPNAPEQMNPPRMGGAMNPLTPPLNGAQQNPAPGSVLPGTTITPAAGANNPAAANNNATPGETAPANAPGSANNMPAPRPVPLQIHSLAEGVKAKGLADMLRESETQMKAGKYNAAIDEYDLADQIAPNNPLILFGRANAELAQSYYGRAESHLRQAFTKSPELLMGQLDLQALIGAERLNWLVQDLKGVAEREQTSATPLFLLSYIAYNTGHEAQAKGYLDLADKRAGGKDDLYSLLRKYWSLPQEPAPAEPMNK